MQNIKTSNTRQQINMFQVVKNVVSIEDVIDRYSPTAKKRYDNICCEFCGDTQYKCQIYPQTNTFYCHKCHATSDVVDYVKYKFSLTSKEALDLIVKDFNLSMENEQQLSVDVQKKIKDTNNKKIEIEKEENIVKQTIKEIQSRKKILEQNYDKIKYHFDIAYAQWLYSENSSGIIEIIKELYWLNWLECSIFGDFCYENPQADEYDNIWCNLAVFFWTDVKLRKKKVVELLLSGKITLKSF